MVLYAVEGSPMGYSWGNKPLHPFTRVVFQNVWLETVTERTPDLAGEIYFLDFNLIVSAGSPSRLMLCKKPLLLPV